METAAGASAERKEELGPDIPGLTLRGLERAIRDDVELPCKECDDRAGARARELAMWTAMDRGQHELGHAMLVYREYVDCMTCTHLGAVALVEPQDFELANA